MKTLVLIALLFALVASKFQVKEIPNISLKYTFEPGQAVDVKNPLPMKLTTHCKITALDDSDDLTGHTNKGTVWINGAQVTGETKVTVKNADTLVLQLTKGADGSITNLGKQTVVADCSLGTIAEFEDEEEEQLPGISLKYTFEPGQAVDVKNPLPMKLTTHCKITALDDSDDLTGHTNKGTVWINGAQVTGETKVTVKNADTLELQLTKGADGSITNLGKQTVVADCSLGAEQIEAIKQVGIQYTIKWTTGQSQNLPISALFPDFSCGCNVTTSDATTAKFGAHVTSNNYVVNDQTYGVGDFTFDIENNNALNIKTSTKGKASIKNNGSNNVTAQCDCSL